MNFLIFGAGAVGGLVGGRFALAGHDVTLLVRPHMAQAISAHGLRIVEGPAAQQMPHVRATTTFADALSNSPDCVVIAVRSFATAQAIRQIQESGTSPPPILCLQNGVDNEALLAEAFGAERVIAGTLTTSVTMDEPGTVVVERERGVGIAVTRPFDQIIARELARAGFTTQTYRNAAAMKWSKMLVNLLGNATAAICDVGTSEVFDHPELYRLEIAALRECLDVMRAKAIAVVNLPRTPSARLAAGLRVLPRWGLRILLRYLLRDARGGKMPSLHAGLARGKKQSEVGWLNGAVVRHGAQAGVATPINRLLTDTLEGILTGAVSWEDYRGKPERLAGLVKF